jgi:ABC-2 type transport system permease protein
MAQAIRETLDVPPGGVALLPFAILAAWGAVGLAVTYRVMTRRN